jgi:hypothetical protein
LARLGAGRRAEKLCWCCGVWLCGCPHSSIQLPPPVSSSPLCLEHCKGTTEKLCVTASLGDSCHMQTRHSLPRESQARTNLHWRRTRHPREKDTSCPSPTLVPPCVQSLPNISHAHRITLVLKSLLAPSHLMAAVINVSAEVNASAIRQNLYSVIHAVGM